MKITLDTNVLISGTFWLGNSFKILEKVKNGEIELILSEEIISEYEEVLSYPEIKDKIKINDLEAKFTLEKLREMAVIVNPSRKIDFIKEDADDNFILECAVEGKVDYIISKDNHLLKLNEFEDIKIITPEKFIADTRII